MPKVKLSNIPFFVLFVGILALANNTKNGSSNYLAYSYLTKYKSIAINEMKKTGIPASITLAQGMYESNFGKSELATKGNNHFGIKCKDDWKGDVIYYTDDEPNECFRKYVNPIDSYRDHSKILLERQHYQQLFKIPLTNYKAWATELKKAGYATDPNYDKKIIAMIQRFKLYEYDSMSQPDEDIIDDVPNNQIVNQYDDIYIYASDGVFIPILGTPNLANQPSNLQRIDLILQQSLENRPTEVLPRSLSGNPVIDVKPEQIKPTIYIPNNNKSNTQTAQITKPKPIATPPQINSKNNNTITAQNINPLSQTVEILQKNPTEQPTMTNEAIFVNNTKAIRYNYPITTTQIAQEYKIPISNLLIYNDLTDPQTSIPPGTNIYTEPKKNKYLGSEKIHIVQNNQTMWDIAQQYALPLADLYKRNAMRETTQPLANEQILLKGKADYPPKIIYNSKQPKNNLTNTPSTTLPIKNTAFSTHSPTTPKTTRKIQYHTVKTGDNLNDIANKYHTTQEKLKSANNLTPNAKLKPGDILLITQ